MSHEDRAQAEAAVEAAIYGRDESGMRRGFETNSVSVLGGAERIEDTGTFWDGGGILKAVDVEQHGVWVPERALMPMGRKDSAISMETPSGL